MNRPTLPTYFYLTFETKHSHESAAIKKLNNIQIDAIYDTNDLISDCSFISIQKLKIEI